MKWICSFIFLSFGAQEIENTIITIWYHFVFSIIILLYPCIVGFFLKCAGLTLAILRICVILSFDAMSPCDGSWTWRYRKARRRIESKSEVSSLAPQVFPAYPCQAMFVSWREVYAALGLSSSEPLFPTHPKMNSAFFYILLLNLVFFSFSLIVGVCVCFF